MKRKDRQKPFAREAELSRIVNQAANAVSLRDLTIPFSAVRNVWLQLKCTQGSSETASLHFHVLQCTQASSEWVVGIDVISKESTKFKSGLAQFAERVLGIDVSKGARDRDDMRLFLPTPYVSHVIAHDVKESDMRLLAESLAPLIGVILVEKPTGIPVLPPDSYPMSNQG